MKTFVSCFAVLVMFSNLPLFAETRPLRVAAGEKLRLELETSVNTTTARNGDPISFRTVDDVRVGDKIAVPRGSLVRGSVFHVKSGELQLRADEILLPDGTSLRLDSSIAPVKRPGSGGTRSKIYGTLGGITTVARTAELGSKLGRLLDGNRTQSITRCAGTALPGIIGTAQAPAGAQSYECKTQNQSGKGGIIGAGVGLGIGLTGVIAKPRPSRELDLPSGTVLEARLDRPIDIPSNILLPPIARTIDAPQAANPQIENISNMPAPKMATPIVADANPHAGETNVRDGTFQLTLNVKLVQIDALVRDGTGMVMNNLRLQDFRVFEDGAEQRIQAFSKDELPLSVAMVVDRSGSVAPRMPDIQRAAVHALAQLKPGDEVCLFSFAADSQRLTDLTTDHQMVANRISTIRPGGGTDITDAIQNALAYLSQSAPDRRRAIILISDNIDGPHPPMEEDQAVRRAIETETAIYSVKIGRNGGYHEQSVQKMTEGTGGEILSGNLDSALAAAVSRLRFRYTLGYAPPANPSTNGYHRIEVRLVDRFGNSHLNYSVLARDGYYNQP